MANFLILSVLCFVCGEFTIGIERCSDLGVFLRFFNVLVSFLCLRA